jgi:arsenate reductase (glutaredoxin)
LWTKLVNIGTFNPMTTVYGITNCTTVQKARKWLDVNGVEYVFHDYKKSGIDTAHLERWCNEFGWEQVLNRSGMMWRKADPVLKSLVVDTKSSIEFMIQVPTSIKRPIIEYNSKLIRGFDIPAYTTFFL